MDYEKKNGKRRKLNFNNHESFFASQIRNLEKIINVLESSYISCDDYDSTKKPFFLNDTSQNKFTMNFKSLSNYNIPETLNRNVILIYRLLGDPDKEIYIGHWTILSLKKALSIYQDYCNNGQNNVFDIGYRYLGMGHVELISCDLETHLLFYRRDGGSNGYDREYNYNNLIKNGSHSYEKFFFSKWFYNILNN